MEPSNQTSTSAFPALARSWVLWGYAASALLLVVGVLLLSVSFFQTDYAKRDAYGKLASLLLVSGMLAALCLRSAEYVATPLPLNPDKHAQITRKTELIANTTVIAILLGLASMVVQRYSGPEGDARSLAVLAMWGGACLLVGVLSGFLFGVPKNMASSQLEQISDWITKIIVGVGLTQLSKIPHQLHSWARVIANEAGSAGTASPSTSFIVAMILYFLTVGFLSGYLLTDMFLADGEDPDSEPEVQQIVKSGGIGVVNADSAEKPG